MKKERRKYEKRKRAKLQEQMHLRIVEAAVALHEVNGPIQTSVSRIAEVAGVGRPTVYRHFPDERSLLTACTGHYFGRHPLPNAADWRQVPQADARLTVGLSELYGWYRRTEPMLTRAFRDLPDLPVLGEVMTPFFATFADFQAALVEPWAAARSPLLQAALGHALAFQTWRSLAIERGLPDDQIIELMRGLVAVAATSGGREGKDHHAV